MKLRNFKKIMSGLLAGALALTSVPAASVSAAEVALSGEISVNPRVHFQTLEGWGTSMCWWGNVIGSWGNEDFNGNGRPDREEIAELAFSPEYLNLNIVRYNVGGGDKTPTSMKRIEGIVPGWTVDMTGKEDGTGEFDAEAFYSKDITEMNDAGQLWMLDQANKWRKEAAEAEGRENDIINEVFSNSPPYYMTKSGSSTGGYNAASNLKEDCYDDFALYMARAGKWIDNYLNEEYGVGVDYIEPMNEPDTNYWSNGSTKQEGCTFDTGAEMSNMLIEMKKALVAEGLDDKIAIQGTDETSLGSAINSFNKLSTEAKNTMGAIGAHTYSGSDAERVTLHDLAASYDKTLWMSEITRGKDGNGHDTAHNSMNLANTSGQSTSMMSDLKLMQPSAWVLWLVADSEYECLQVNGNWGLIHAVFEEDGPVKDYHKNLFNSDGTVKDGVPEKGFWACTKQFYVMMQYSKFLKAGYTMIDIGDNDMCAAISPDGKELVIVANNFSKDRNTTVDLSKFDNVGSAKVYRTSDDYSCELVETQDVSDGILDVTLPATSVSTYVIEVEADTENYTTSVTADVQTPSEAGIVVGDMNKFTLTGKWSGSTSYTAGSAATFKFEGNRALVYGTKSNSGALLNVSVDGGEEVEVDLNAATTMSDTMIFDTGDLENGTHTITMTIAEGQTNKRLVLSGAEIVHGDLIVDGPVIRKVVNYDGALKIVFDEVKGSAGYTIKYGTTRRNLDQKVAISNTSAVLKGLENGKTYYVQIEDSLGGVSNIYAGIPGGDDTNVLYFVDAGTDDVNAPEAGDSLGKYNSNLDQVYGEDEITGKKWGYVDNSNGAEYRDGDALTSIRIDEQDKANEGLEYKFELPSGEYTVTVAMLDPWANNSRNTDIVINGVTKDTKLLPKTAIIKSYDITQATDEMVVRIIRSNGNTNKDADPLVSYIIIEEKDNDAIASVDNLETISTVAGVLPTLPETVTVTTKSGEKKDLSVKWDEINASDFLAFGETVVTGTVEDGKYEIKQNVKVQKVNEQQVVYFIDCSNPSSTKHAELLANGGLLNTIPDQAYIEGQTTWGYVEALGGSSPNATAGESFSTGWWADTNQDIQYRVPLDAGSYNVYFGLAEWWNVTRPMKLVAYYDNKTVNLGTATVSKNVLTLEAGGELALDAAKNVILSVEKYSGQDPVLSYIRIEKTLDTAALKGAINRALYLDKSEMTDAIKNAVAEGNAVLLNNKATQADLDAVVETINSALGSVEEDVLEVRKAELNTALAEASALNKASYTKSSVEEFDKVVESVSALADSDTATASEVEKATKTLAEAQTKLVTLESVLAAAIAYNAADNTGDVYSERSWSVYEAALNAAEALIGTEYTEEDMNAKITALEAACDKLVNVVEMSGVIEEAKAVNAGLYTAASYAAVDAAIKDAEAALKTDTIEQADLDEKAVTIKNAIRGLITIESVFKTALRKNKLTSSEGYTSASWKAYEDAYNKANALYAAGGYTEEQMNAEITNVQNAIAGLVKGSDPIVVPDKDKDTTVKVNSITLTNKYEAKNIAIAKGKTTTITATVGPDNATLKDVEWISSNPGVVKITKVKGDTITVKGVKKGSATIKAVAKDGSKTEASIKVTVKKGKVTKLTLKSKKNVSVKAGKSTKIKVNVKASSGANKTLLWKSSKPEVTKINAKTGKVTILRGTKKKTKVTIEITSTDGTNKKVKVTLKVK